MNKPATSLDSIPSSSGSRYEMLTTIASGGMATVYVGRLRGMGGFSRTVAVKRAHPHLLQDPTYRAMLVDEARLAAKLHHPNVVAVLDVEELEGELSLVMDYVEGASLYDLIEACQTKGPPLHPRIAMRVALDACAGLHAAHMLLDEDGNSLGLVHRDVSPQNILVGLDGVSRLSDFGIAKHAEGAATSTGVLKGKLSYMAPEYLEHTQLDWRSDVFSLGVVVWEALAGQKLFRGKSELETFKKVVATVVPPLSSLVPWSNERLDAILFGALARDPEHRYQSAEELGIALEEEARYDNLIATPAEVGACVREHFGAALEERRAEVRRRSGPVSTGGARGSTPSTPGGARTSAPGSDPASVLARSQAPTMVARPPTPVPVAKPAATAEVSGLQRRAELPPPPSAPVDVGGAETPPNPPGPEPQIPTSSGGLWKVALVLGVVAVGGAIAFFAMQSGRGGSAPNASSSAAAASPSVVATAASPSVVATAPPRPITPSAPSTAPTVAPLSVDALPDATQTRKPGKMPKGHASTFPVTTGIPLSAWPPAQPPPEPPPDLPAPAPPASAPPAPASPAPAPPALRPVTEPGF